MIEKKIQDALNDQINAEIFSAYLYLSASAHLAETNLGGAAKWMRMQAKEELSHAMKILDYVHDRGGTAVFDEIEKPGVRWGSPRSVFEKALEHERKITGRIHALVELAAKERDHATSNLLQWFVNEQVEEEKNAAQIADWYKAAGDGGAAVFQIDAVLAKRAE